MLKFMGKYVKEVEMFTYCLRCRYSQTVKIEASNIGINTVANAPTWAWANLMHVNCNVQTSMGK